MLRTLRGDNVVVAVEVKGALGGSIAGEKRFGGIRAKAAAIEACLAKAFFEKANAGAIVFAGRIFRGDGDELGEQRGHFIFALVEPGNDGVAMRGWGSGGHKRMLRICGGEAKRHIG